MKCANCSNDARYIYRLTPKNGIGYCDKDLPKFLEERRKAGLLELVPETKAAIDTALKNITTAIPAPTEEPITEETPAPSKKSIKKTAE